MVPIRRRFPRSRWFDSSMIHRCLLVCASEEGTRRNHYRRKLSERKDRQQEQEEVQIVATAIGAYEVEIITGTGVDEDGVRAKLNLFSEPAYTSSSIWARRRAGYSS